MAATRSLRFAVMVVMNVFWVIALLLTARVLVEYFGGLAATAGGQGLLRVTDVFVLPVGIPAPRTPYGGVYDVEAAVTIVVVLLLEWMLSIVRSRA